MFGRSGFGGAKYDRSDLGGVVTSGGLGVAVAEEHEHQYHFTREPDVLAMTAKALDQQPR